MSDTPARISVCIPARNAAEFLGETLRTVLAQDSDDFEVVVSDNASTDATPDILASCDDPRMSWSRAPDSLDIRANFARATAAARGTYLKVVCADDLIHPRALSTQAAVLDERPDVSLVASRKALVDAEGRTLRSGLGLRDLTGLSDGRRVVRSVVRRGGINPIGEPGSVMFRRRDFMALGGWPQGHAYTLDIALWVRLLQRGHMWGIAEDLTAFRVSPGALSSAHSQAQYEENRAFVESIATDPRWRVPRHERLAAHWMRRLVWEAWPRRQALMEPGEPWLASAGTSLRHRDSADWSGGQ